MGLFIKIDETAAVVIGLSLLVATLALVQPSVIGGVVEVLSAGIETTIQSIMEVFD